MLPYVQTLPLCLLTPLTHEVVSFYVYGSFPVLLPSLNAFWKWSVRLLSASYDSVSIALVGLKRIFIRGNKVIKQEQQTSVALSPQVNYTDWETATCRRNLVPTLVEIEFSRPKPLLFFQVSPHLSSRGWVDPVPDPLLLRKSGSTGNRTQDLWVSSQINIKWWVWDGSKTVLVNNPWLKRKIWDDKLS
jgi:hypothetical protein